MSWTRRDFLATAALASAAAAVPLPHGSFTPGPFPYDGPAYLHGDAFLSAVARPGLPGRSIEEVRHLALRLRTPAVDRDRYVLGLPEALHA